MTPDWVRRNLRRCTELALVRMAELGYPGVPSDAGKGGSAQFDVYLADIGSAGLYGYCAPEHRCRVRAGHASSFCVFDNDFTGFPMPPDESLRVTAAHELFHAVQFGIDVARTGGSSSPRPPGWRSRSPTTSTTTASTSPRASWGDAHTPLDPSAADLGSTATGSSSSS